MNQDFSAGLTVRARGTRFIVLSCDVIPGNGAEPLRRLHLRCIDDAWRNQEIYVLPHLEPVEPDQIPELDLAHPGRLGRFHLLMDAIRLSLAPGDDRLVASSRSRIRFEPYQLVPALRALELPRPRVLIADDVGLGKTIEAGLVLRELNARRRANRILIVCPASILEQWQTELASKFGFEFRIFDSEGVAEARRSLEAGSNPWAIESRVIASVDFIKRREGAFRELSASRWDVIIIDEAHHLAAGRNDDEVTDRYRLARWIATENTGALLLLTATPHDGYDENFASLLELLEPSLVTPGRPLRFEHYRRHMVRRLKRHIRLPNGELKFVERLPVEPIPVPLLEGSPEHRLNEAVRDEAFQLDLVAQKALKSDREIIRLVATILRKRAASSLAALRSTIAERRRNIEESVTEVEIRREYLRAYNRGEAIPESAQQRLERDLHRSYQSAMQRSGRELHRLKDETESLTELQSLADACAGHPEPKLVALTEWLRRCDTADPAAKVIVFSEYADTVDAICAHLNANGFAGQLVRLTSDVGGRQERAAALKRFFSPEARILVATDVAGEGLNLHQHCHHLVHFELPWNPNRMEQRNGRIDRYGQTEPPVIAFLFAEGTYEGEVLKRLVLKIENQMRRLGSVGDILGQIQAERIEQILTLPVHDLQRAVAEAEAQIDDELNRAADPRIREQIGEGEENLDEQRRAEAAHNRECDDGVALDRFLERAVQAAGGSVERHGEVMRIKTPPAWVSAELPARYDSILPSGARIDDEALANEVLHEDHTLIQAAVRWVRASRFRKEDDHRLAYVVDPALASPDLVATFLVVLRDGNGLNVQRFESVRVGADLSVSRDSDSDDGAARSTHPGNAPSELLNMLFESWWVRARELAEAEALRRAEGWREDLLAFRGVEVAIQKPEVTRWDAATRAAILGDYERRQQQDLFGEKPLLPPAVRRRLDQHQQRAAQQREYLEHRLQIDQPAVESLGVLLRVPASMVAGESL